MTQKTPHLFASQARKRPQINYGFVASIRVTQKKNCERIITLYVYCFLLQAQQYRVCNALIIKEGRADVAVALKLANLLLHEL